MDDIDLLIKEWLTQEIDNSEKFRDSVNRCNDLDEMEEEVLDTIAVCGYLGLNGLAELIRKKVDETIMLTRGYV